MYILLASLILVVLWLLFKPGWAPKPPDTRGLTDRAGQMSKTATDRGSQLYTGLRGRLKFRADKKELAQRFKLWAAESGPTGSRLAGSLPESAGSFAAWLEALSDKELTAFSQDVARFCAGRNFDVAWLNDAQVAAEPALQQAVEDAVLLYGVACWRANQVQSDVKAMKLLKAFLAAPGRNKEFGQQLFSALAAEGLVQASPSLLIASEKDRLAYMANAIQQAAQGNPSQFSAALQRSADAGSATTPPAATLVSRAVHKVTRRATPVAPAEMPA